MRTTLFAALLTVLAAGPTLSAATPPDVVVLVVYHSQTGNTATMAKAVEAGARTVPGVRVVSKTIDKVTADDLLGADAVIVGTPVHNAGMSADVTKFIEGWPFGKLKDKVGAAFCAGGATSAGEELTLVGILTRMLIFQFVVIGGETWQAPFGASAITEEGHAVGTPAVSAQALERAQGLGARVARYAQYLKAGRDAATGK